MSDSVAYIWLTGHVRNVGDSMLRRPYAEVISEVSDIYIWAGNPSNGYIQGLRVDPAQLAPSFINWYLSLARNTITGRADFAFNPGEFSVTKPYFAGMTLLLPWLILARLKGGKIIWIGGAIASTKRGVFWPFRILARLADLLYWRDNRSREIVGFGEERPDWGFALRSGGKMINVLDSTSEDFPGFEQRQHIGIALRGDRPYPSKEWLAAIESFAKIHNYRIIAISQVEDDSIYAERIARDLGGEALLWSGGDHFAQEERVRDAYRKTAAVFSDRLHGLIIAATEGAVPLGWVETATDKLNRHLKVVDADWAIPSASPVAQIQSLTREELLMYYGANIGVVTQSRERLLGVMNEIQQTLSADARS